MRRADPITLEVMRNAFQSIAEEMGAALIRTALSPNIKDRRDCSTALYSAAGELVAQAEHIPLHLGLMTSVVKKVLEVVPIARLAPGDTVVTNDPYVSGSHLPDLCLLSPCFVGGQVLGVLANLAHHVDIGGIAPGGAPTNATEIFQEGLRIPPIKLVKAGVLDEEIMALIASNVRTGREVRGDLQAQLAANNVGLKRLGELAAGCGAETAAFYMDEIMAYSDRLMRARLKEVDQGVYTFEDFLEGDGLSEDLLRIKATVVVERGKVTVDFSGTSPQARGSVNCTRAVTLACVYYALKAAIDPELPSSGGTFKVVEVITPLGSLVNPRFPAPVSNANINTSQRIADVVLGALAQALPKKVPAASSGSMNIFTVGGLDPRSGEYYSYVETYGGGQGALFDQDGLDGVHTNMTNTLNTPVEVIEAAYPLRVERYGLVPDSDGPGRFRGGLGLSREMTVLDHRATISLGAERRRLRPWGLYGGRHGGASESWLEAPSGRREDLPCKVTREVEPDVRLILKTAGAGGWGDPMTRDPELVRQDVIEGFISLKRAREEYGVILDQENRQVDEAATSRLRRAAGRPEPGKV